MRKFAIGLVVASTVFVIHAYGYGGNKQERPPDRVYLVFKLDNQVAQARAFKEQDDKRALGIDTLVLESDKDVTQQAIRQHLTPVGQEIPSARVSTKRRMEFLSCEMDKKKARMPAAAIFGFYVEPHGN